jgi:hypothetical protein
MESGRLESGTISTRSRPRAGLLASRAVLLALLSATLLGIAAASASAVIVRLSNGHRISFQPLPGELRTAGTPAKPATPAAGRATRSRLPLEYHGGPVMPSNVNIPIYWDPTGGSSFPSEYQSKINTYFEDLAHDSGGVQNTESVGSQYSDAEGHFANYQSQFVKAPVDKERYPANGCSAASKCLTDQQLRVEIEKFVMTQGLPTDVHHAYYLLTPAGVEDCFDASSRECSAGAQASSYCAYHSVISTPKGPIVYANDPYVSGLGCDVGEQHPNENASDATIGGGMAHEHSEMVTDPELNAWFDRLGAENGDKCRTFSEATEFGAPVGLAPDGAKYNQLIKGHFYYYQQEWSNDGSKCAQRQLPPLVKKVSPRRGPSAGGTRVDIFGEGFRGATAVSFGSVPGLEVKVLSSTVIQVTAPAQARGMVDILVSTPAGPSAIIRHDHFRYSR